MWTKGLSSLLFLYASSLSAGVLNITVTSQGTLADPNEWNDHGPEGQADNVVIPSDGYDSSWDALSGAAWVSFDNTVCPGCVDNGGNPTQPPPGHVFYNPTSANDSVTFTQIFDIPAGMAAVGGVLNVLADDSVTILLNERTLGSYLEPDILNDPWPLNFKLNNGNGIGGGFGLGYFQSALRPGQNVLQFQVRNFGAHNIGSNGDGTGGVSSFGLAYSLSLDLDPVPEPGSMVLMALGLLLVGCVAKKSQHNPRKVR